MSLLTERMTDCTRLIQTDTADGYGGSIAVWEAGETFPAAVVYISSPERRIAGRDGVISDYYVYTSRATILQYGEALRRESDGKILRITSDGEDEYTPESAGLDIRRVTAVEWSLEDNG